MSKSSRTAGPSIPEKLSINPEPQTITMSGESIQTMEIGSENGYFWIAQIQIHPQRLQMPQIIISRYNAHDDLVVENARLKTRSNQLEWDIVDDKKTKDTLVAALREELKYWLKELDGMSAFDRDAFPELYKEYKGRKDGIEQALKDAGEV